MIGVALVALVEVALVALVEVALTASIEVALTASIEVALVALTVAEAEAGSTDPPDSPAAAARAR